MGKKRKFSEQIERADSVAAAHDLELFQESFGIFLIKNSLGLL